MKRAHVFDLEGVVAGSPFVGTLLQRTELVCTVYTSGTA